MYKSVTSPLNHCKSSIGNLDGSPLKFIILPPQLPSVSTKTHQQSTEMPLDSGTASSGGRFSGLGDDLLLGGYKDACRERLHFLFAQIEKEFDTLYMENLNRESLNRNCS